MKSIFITSCTILFYAATSYAQFPSGCVAYYPFSGNFKDSLGKSTTGTNHGSGFTTDRNGQLRKALVFNSIYDDYVDLGSSYSYSSMTLSAWIYPYVTSDETIIFSNLANITQFTNTGFEVRLRTDGKLDILIGNVSYAPYSYRQMIGSTALSFNKWSHIAIVLDNMSSLKTYINGSLDASSSMSGISFGTSQYNMTVGARSYPKNESPYSGMVDDVMFISRALAASEIPSLSEIVKASFGAKTQCSGTTVTFVDSSTAPSGSSYRWSFGDNGTSTSKTPQHTYASEGTYKVTLVIKGPLGATDTAIRYIYTGKTPHAYFNTIITGLKAKFIPADSTMSVYMWDFGDSTSSLLPRPTHTYNNYGFYIVTLHSRTSAGCDSTFQKSILIYDQPKADFEVQDACAGYDVQINNKSFAGGSLSYLWNFGDNTGSSLKNPSHKYAKAGKYRISLKVSTSTGNFDTTSRVVTVHNSPTADFTFTTNKFKASFTVIDSGLNTYAWDFGDSSMSQQKNTVHNYNIGGSYQVSLQIKNKFGCPSTVKKTVLIYEMPKAAFGSKNVCFGLATHFTDSSISQTSTLTYAWDFGDKTTSALRNPSHIYAAPGTYAATLKITNNGAFSDSIVKNVTVYPLPDASFTTIIHQRTVFFLPKDSTLASYKWDFGDSSNSISPKPVHTYSFDGTHNVQLAVVSKYGCDSVASRAINLSGIAIISLPEKNLYIYPNPNINGQLHLELSQAYGDYQISILNMEGKECYLINIKDAQGVVQEIIDMKGYKSGMYLIKLASKQNTLYQKIIVP